MGAEDGSRATWTLPAEPSAVGQMRLRATGFASGVGVSKETAQDVGLAVSEAVTNVVVHAYAGTEPGPVTVSCRLEEPRLIVEILDEGAGMTVRHDSPGAGQGLAIVGAVAETLDVTQRTDRSGTCLTISFGGSAVAQEVRGLEPLCALALETVADVSCVDIVSGGVLRRAAAEVADEAELTTWLRGAAPPAKPGTATWSALREGGARLVVHDPSVPRAPGGTGEQLGLRWWVAVPVEGPGGTPAAIWGLGGRDGGRRVPSKDVMRALADAGRTGLAEETQRDALRARLRGCPDL